MLDHQISSYMITWSTSSVRKSCKSFVPRNKVLSFNSMIQSLPHPPPFITMAIGINLLINYFGMALRPNRWCECEPHTLMGLLRQKKKTRPSCCTRPFSVQVHTLLATGKIQLNYNLLLLPPASTSTKCHFSVILLFSKADTPLLIKMEGWCKSLWLLV